VLIGFAVLRWLTNQPKDAPWLTPQQRDSLAATLAAEATETTTVTP
jgi:hypothetical protein